jgi:hypothetical protein
MRAFPLKRAKRRSILVILAWERSRSTAGFSHPLHQGTARQDDAQHAEGQRVRVLAHAFLSRVLSIAPASSSRVREMSPVRSSSTPLLLFCLLRRSHVHFLTSFSQIGTFFFPHALAEKSVGERCIVPVYYCPGSLLSRWSAVWYSRSYAILYWRV